MERRQAVKACDSFIRLLYKLEVTKEHPYSFFGIWPDEIDFVIHSFKKRVMYKENRHDQVVSK